MEQAPSGLQNVGKQLSNIKLPDVQQLTQGVTDTAKAATSSVASTRETLGNTLNSFSSQSVINASQSFLDSNSIIAKFVFLIFVLIVFLVAMNLGISLLMYFLSPPRNPAVIDGLLTGNTPITVTQDPKNKDSVMIFRSNNQSKGLEATWSVWLNIDGLTNAGKLAHVFNKGNDIYDTTGYATVNNGPGLYIKPDTNTIQIVMDEANTQKACNISLDNIPLKKWFHVVMRIQNNILDVYINGIISSRYVFNGVPKQNYDSVNVCQNGGFSGKLSNLFYYDHALSIFDINNLVLRGPNLTESSKVKSNIGNYTYLSNTWYASRM